MSPELVAVLVQPERDDREMYADLFRYQGWRAGSVSAARDALRVAPSADVIITGLVLQGDIDGVELIARLKADDRTKCIPVIVLTACVGPTERARAEKAGCDAFLVKPCLPDDLVRTVRRMIARRRVPKPRSANARPALEPRARHSSS